MGIHTWTAMVITLLCMLCSLLTVSDSSSADVRDRENKLLNVFNIVTFPNDGCVSGGVYGVCYTASECSAKGGTSDGTCASGFGVCCKFSGTCGGTTSLNNTYFKSTDADTSPCTFTVCKCSSDICSIRLNFDTFSTDQPSSSFPAAPTSGGYGSSRGQCLTSQFQISNDGPAAPTICGTNTGYHMIVDAEDDCNEMSFTWTSTNTQTWNIQIMQISCDAEWRPPQGCLQYFTGTTGTINSYNWDGGRHLASQQYSNCVRTEAGYCSIGYEAHIADTDFQISGTTAANQVLQNTSPTACSYDYILIPQGAASAIATDATHRDRFCGDYLAPANPDPSITLSTAATGGAVYTRIQPFIVGVYFDGQEINTGGGTEEASAGFTLQYTQAAC